MATRKKIELGKALPMEKLLAIEPHMLSDKDLALYIQSIKKEYAYTIADAGGYERSNLEFSVLLMLAVGERNVRATTRLAKRSLAIAGVALLVAIAGIWL